jgi:hypothetical protein
MFAYYNEFQKWMWIFIKYILNIYLHTFFIYLGNSNTELESCKAI